MVEQSTVSTVYIEPKAAQPTQDSTKDFTPKMETTTVREKARDRDSMPRKPFRTEVRNAQGKNKQQTNCCNMDLKELVCHFNQLGNRHLSNQDKEYV